MLKVSEERPLHPAVPALLQRVSDAAKRLDTPFVVAGATARDIVLKHVFSREPARATQDVDVAVCAVDWKSYESMIDELLKVEGFRRDSSAQQRLMFTHAETRRTIPLDIVPFGDIEERDGTIAWPPKGEFVLTVLGFREAVETALQVEIDPGIVVPVVALPALTLLKLIAWQDRRQVENKDAYDLFFILQNYLWAGNEERVFGDDAIDLMETYEFNDSLASCALLGRDARKIALPETLEKIRSLLSEGHTYQTLQKDLLARAAASTFEDTDPDKVEAALEAFRDGFLAEKA
jgi:predicted nucleotidyltransferase